MPVVLFLAIPALALAEPPSVNRPGLPLRREPVEVRLVDGSRLFLTLNDAEIAVTTPYGPLKLKLAEIQRIEFGRRAPAAVAGKVDAAVAALRTADNPEAWAALAEAGEWAYQPLQALTRSSDAAVAAKARERMAKLKQTIPAERLRSAGRDSIVTDNSRFSGRVDLTELQAVTPLFGPIKLKVADVALMQQGDSAEPDEVPVNVQPDPSTLSNFQQQVGKVLFFRVTGAAGGSVWGTDVYTTDSSLAAVAVHAGVLKMGQTGVVKVTILQGQNAYTGSTRNGIGTSPYGQYPGSYKVSRVGRGKDE